MNKFVKQLLVVFTFTILFLSESGFAAEPPILVFQPRVGYQFPRFFQAGVTTTYPGSSYGAQLFYRMQPFAGSEEALTDTGFAALMFAPMVSIHYGNFQNTANTSAQSETLTETTISAGLKFYFSERFFIQGHYSWTTVKDVATGTSNVTIKDSSTGLGAAIGLNFPLSEHFGIETSGEMNSVNFDPKSGGFSTPTQYLRFGAFLGINFVIPSGSGKKSAFSISK